MTAPMGCSAFGAAIPDLSCYRILLPSTLIKRKKAVSVVRSFFKFWKSNSSGPLVARREKRCFSRVFGLEVKVVDKTRK